MKIAIIGFAREGRAIYKYLRNRSSLDSTQDKPGYKKVEWWVLDRDDNLKVPKGVRAVLGEKYLDDLEKYDLVYRSPGVPLHLLKKAKKISSLTKLFFEEYKGKIIGVTGTKGKGTTSTLLYKILKANEALRLRSGQPRKEVFLAGNIGVPALEVLDTHSTSSGQENSLVVLELSSFQLHDLTQSPEVAVVLGIFPDHQDAHKNLKEYYEAKASIAKFQKKSDVVFYVKNNPVAKKIAEMSTGRKIPVDLKNFDLFKNTEMGMAGVHNYLNAVMAASVAKYLGVKDGVIKKEVLKFKGNEHRMQLVKEIDEVRFYNDSASTNPKSTSAAVASFKEDLVLIAGGLGKGLDYSEWQKTLDKPNLKKVVLIGENKKDLLEVLRNLRNKIVLVESLKEAVDLAKEEAGHGSVVLFSPGAASFDMFLSYADRGQKFVSLLE